MYIWPLLQNEDSQGYSGDGQPVWEGVSVPEECPLDGQCKEESLPQQTCCSKKTNAKGCLLGSIFTLLELSCV